MFFGKELLSTSAGIAHWQALWSKRNTANEAFANYVANNKTLIENTVGHPIANATNFLGVDFWKDLDKEAVQLRAGIEGIEILDDLQRVQRVLNVGKTARTYFSSGEIADDVSVSIDGQAPFSFDHTDMKGDGDPIPVFASGFGVNWRHALGLKTIDIDLVSLSREEKYKKHIKKLVDYMLNGDKNIVVDKYPAQGIKNHRNTNQIDIPVDLTTASSKDVIEFFSGAFSKSLIQNRIPYLDILWVSYDIWQNLVKPSMVTINKDTMALGPDILSDAMKYLKAKEVKPTFVLEGNEFIGYQRNQSVICPLVGMPTSEYPLPRFVPQHNYNFQIMTIAGLQIKADADGRSGVVYGSKAAA